MLEIRCAPMKSHDHTINLPPKRSYIYLYHVQYVQCPGYFHPILSILNFDGHDITRYSKLINLSFLHFLPVFVVLPVPAPGRNLTEHRGSGSIFAWRIETPPKQPKNHQVEKEHHLPSTSIFGFKMLLIPK